MPRRNDVADIFKWINTHNNDPSVCWEWLGRLSGRDGRGYFTVDGIRELAFHIVYRLFGCPNGNVEKPNVHRHRCDNEVCCNPFHVEPGSRSDNEQDKYTRDRAGYTHDMVKEMKRMFKLGMNAHAIVAHVNTKFGTDVSYGGVYKVIAGHRRKS